MTFAPESEDLRIRRRLKVARFIASVAVIALAAGCYSQLPQTEPAAPIGYSRADAEYFGDNLLMVPVDGVEPRNLRDSFNAPRGADRIHGAIDIPAPRGTPVVAAIDGEVIRLRQNTAGGVTAYLVDASRRYVYYYAHLDRYSDQMTEGLVVRQGFVIGYVGTSGNAPPDVPHLHFQAMRLAGNQREWWNGTPVDVRSFMARKGKARNEGK